MPPKKTKPNEKCHCGSGKKHKKCCMHQRSGGTTTTTAAATTAATTAATNSSVVSSAATILFDVMNELWLTNSTTAATIAAASDNSPCFHGSTSNHFPDGRSYNKVIVDYLSLTNGGTNPSAVKDFVSNRGHDEDFVDLNFSRYIFALCTSWYLKLNGTTPELNDLNRMKDLIFLAFRIKYFNFPLYEEETPDLAKYDRYHRAIHNNDERGVINCLSKETKSYCNCMKEKKTEADNMEIIETCTGCNLNFPRSGMKKCSGCKFAMFCTTEDCYAKYWPAHKEICEKKTKATNVLIGRYGIETNTVTQLGSGQDRSINSDWWRILTFWTGICVRKPTKI